MWDTEEPGVVWWSPPPDTWEGADRIVQALVGLVVPCLAIIVVKIEFIYKKECNIHLSLVVILSSRV